MLWKMGDLAVEYHALEMGDLAVGGYEDGGALPLCDVALTETCPAVETGVLTVECPAVEMGDLTVECYEDGGALPLGNVARNEKVILDK
jgi:hypothetical protein